MDWQLDDESFWGFLAWLDPDRDRAALIYEDIRARLIRIFVCAGCEEAEELADETINRVARKIDLIAPKLRADPGAYFAGVARLVKLEYFRRRRRKPAPLEESEVEFSEVELGCLEACLNDLVEKDRSLILEYYQGERDIKISRRKSLARQLGIGMSGLRARACRIRLRVRACFFQCVAAEA